MKKVGLVSVRNYNYGSILQAYALQQELFAAGIDNELIYYKKRNVVKQALRIFNLPLLMAKTKDVWRVIEGKTNPKLKPIISGRNRAFSNFLKDNFVFTPCLSGRKQLIDYTKKFDAFILGSDQVWNPMLLGGDYYTLTWVDSRRPKVTYASSFGVSEIPASQVKKTKEYLSRFNMISVREKQGAEIVEKLTGKKAEVCCDPTVLTDRKRWDELSGDCPFVSEKYIFCYFIGNNPSQREFAKKLAQKTGCKILAVKHIDEYIKSDDDFGDIDYLEVGPKEFVNFIRYATYVCTDSFHGSCFSIINEKKFMIFNRYDEQSTTSKNSRIDSLCSSLGLSERRYRGNVLDIEKEIDYRMVKSKFAKIYSETEKYLDHAFEGV